jgi:hypothetical protein
MVTLHDFFSLGLWFALMMACWTFDLPFDVELKPQDKAFVALCALIFMELVWLRVGYPAP